MAKQILIVDDHPMVLMSLQTTLEQHQYQVTTAQSLASARQLLAAAHDFEMLLLDYNLGEHWGAELFESELHFPSTVVIISGITSHNDIMTALTKCRAQAFISKNIPLSNLPLALDSINSDWKYPHIWNDTQLSFVTQNELTPKDKILTKRELEVYALLLEGLSDKQIAEQLCRSIHTVRIHVRAVKRKCNVARRGV